MLDAMEGPGLKAQEIDHLIQRILEGEPGFVVERRSGGYCFFCTGRLGREVEVPRLFAVAADGGMLLRLPKEEREAAVERGVCEPNSVLPRWVLEPSGRQGRLDGGVPEHDRTVHGDPMEWVWMPIPDNATFERRRPHVVETLEYCRFSLEREQAEEVERT